MPAKARYFANRPVSLTGNRQNARWRAFVCKMDYSTYIASNEWSKKRLARLELDGYKCRLCDENGTQFQLEVHHRPSSYTKIPNESVEYDLVTLCSRCHELITSAIREDRYGRREYEIEPIINVSQERKDVCHGMAKGSVQVECISPGLNAQRADSRSSKQMVEVDQGDFIEAQQGRIRL